MATPSVSKGAQIAVGAVLVALLIGWYGYSNLEAAASYQYFETLDEFVKDGAPAGGRSIRIHGYVADGSIERDVEARQVRFAIQNDPPHAGGPIGTTLTVRLMGLETPDLFKDGAEVVVEGSVESSGTGTVFVADNVLAKCPSKFEAKAQEARS